jgi:hypothetical protein
MLTRMLLLPQLQRHMTTFDTFVLPSEIAGTHILFPVDLSLSLSPSTDFVLGVFFLPVSETFRCRLEWSGMPLEVFSLPSPPVSTSGSELQFCFCDDDAAL